MAKIALPKNTRASRQAFISKLRANPEYRSYWGHSRKHSVWQDKRYKVVTLCPNGKQYPRPEELKHQLLVAAQAPGLEFNEDGDFSARHLTDWYVARFNELNHLKA